MWGLLQQVIRGSVTFYLRPGDDSSPGNFHALTFPQQKSKKKSLKKLYKCLLRKCLIKVKVILRENSLKKDRVNFGLQYNVYALHSTPIELQVIFFLESVKIVIFAH